MPSRATLLSMRPILLAPALAILAACDAGSSSGAGSGGGATVSSSAVASSSSGTGGLGGMAASVSSSSAGGSGGSGGANPVGWPKRFGDNTSDASDLVSAIAIDPVTGDVIIAGRYDGTCDLGGGAIVLSTDDSFLARYTSAGQFVWAAAVPGVDVYRIVQLDTGRTAFLGQVSPSAHYRGIVGVAGKGGVLDWSLAFAGGPQNSAEPNALRLDSAGNLVVGGTAQGTFDFGGIGLNAVSNAFLAKLDSTGHVLWARVVGKGDADGTEDIALDAADNIFLAGNCGPGGDLGGGVVGQPKILTSACIAKYDSNGGYLWSAGIPSTDMALLRAVIADASGNAYFGGGFVGSIDLGNGYVPSAGGLDMFLLKVDASGNHLWQKTYGGKAPPGDEIDEEIYQLAIKPNGNLLIGAACAQDSTFGGPPFPPEALANACVAELLPDGSHVLSQSFGASLEDRGLTVAVSATGTFFGGQFRGIVDFNGTKLDAHNGWADGFVMKLP